MSGFRAGSARVRQQAGKWQPGPSTVLRQAQARVLPDLLATEGEQEGLRRQGERGWDVGVDGAGPLCAHSSEHLDALADGPGPWASGPWRHHCSTHHLLPPPQFKHPPNSSQVGVDSETTGRPRAGTPGRTGGKDYQVHKQLQTPGPALRGTQVQQHSSTSKQARQHSECPQSARGQQAPQKFSPSRVQQHGGPQSSRRWPDPKLPLCPAPPR